MIGKRVQNVFDCMAEGKVQQALGELYSAVWTTSGALYGTAGEKCCCRFLRERMEIILATWFGNVSAPGMSVTLRTGDEPIPLEDIIFDILIRASQGQDSPCRWVKGDSVMIVQNGRLTVSHSMIWGITLAVITCPANRDQQVQRPCWISMMTFKYLVDDLWGKEQQVRQMVEMLSFTE